jgi:hypothetical protein
LYTNVQDVASRAAANCAISAQGCEASELLFGSNGFYARRRLTGFGFTRNIIRTRTMRRAVLDASCGA